MYIYKGDYAYTYYLVSLFRGHRSNGIPGAISTPASQILVSKYYLPIKETRALRRND